MDLSLQALVLKLLLLFPLKQVFLTISPLMLIADSSLATFGLTVENPRVPDNIPCLWTVSFPTINNIGTTRGYQVRKIVFCNIFLRLMQLFPTSKAWELWGELEALIFIHHIQQATGPCNLWY